MANSGIVVLFHAALCRIVRSDGPASERTQRAQAAIAAYTGALKRSAAIGSDQPADTARIDRELAAIADRLETWKLLGGETALACEGALAAVRRERINNLCDGQIGDLPVAADAPGYSQLTRLFSK